MGMDLESSLTLKSKEGKVFLETVNITFEQMCAMCGVLQVLCGKTAMEHGADLDAVRDHMWEIYEAAMMDLQKG